jgi:hypothetical protein
MLESTAEICFPKALWSQCTGISSNGSKLDLPRVFLVLAKLKYHLQPN